MEDIIKKILEFDETERKMLDEAKARGRSAEEELMKIRAKISKEYRQQTEKKFEQLQNKAADDLQIELRREESESEKTKAHFEEIYRQKRDELVAEIYTRVVKND